MNSNVNTGVSICFSCINKRALVPTNNRFMVECSEFGYIRTKENCKKFYIERDRDPDPQEKKIDMLSWTGV